MTYWALNAIFLGLVGVMAVSAGWLSLANPARRRARAMTARRLTVVVAIGITLVILLITTAVFDNIMIGVGLVGYDSAKISGAFIGIAPLEDFAYAVAAAVLLPSVWVLLAPSASRADAPEGDR